ncbi:hypothetical protein AAFJ72_11315 [Brevibacillus gelatini]|uniref:hypothetical protein n=1 Tax=Brevibacillus gelatini TaxID=1655277 RepID=UPI003D815FE4
MTASAPEFTITQERNGLATVSFGCDLNILRIPACSKLASRAAFREDGSKLLVGRPEYGDRHLRFAG